MPKPWEEKRFDGNPADKKPDHHEVMRGLEVIPERERVELELRATKDYLKTVLNNVHDAIFIHDVQGKIIDVNRKTLEMYRVSREEAIEFSIADGYSAPGNPVERLPLVWKQVISGQDQHFEWKARRPKDGSEFEVEVFPHQTAPSQRGVCPRECTRYHGT